MNSIKNLDLTKNQTPIEIALGIDENGMTTAKKLYEFLEFAPQHYARWCKSNITENEFATENEDYFHSPSMESEQGRGNFAQDFKLTARFAKKLSMKGNGERAEQAREYFTKVEDVAKQMVVNRKELPQDLQSLYMLVDNQAKIYLEQKRQAEQLNRIEQKQEVIFDTFAKDSDEDFQAWAKKCISRIAESPNYCYGQSRGQKYALATNESYERLNRKRPCRLNDRVQKAVGRAIEENPSIRKSELDKITKMYVIVHDKDLKTAYELVLKEMTACYCGEVA